ncbi:carbamoyl phosphate synthase small subunit [Limosilactobacillus panis]|uniref:carbamoyl phosphate synthase small subunit n=1 Tax=Limosilactobacillus panis TaxID=47493 RepID=UPI001C95E896|nr:carbamoyl phosphate synthase small subunit [Limosilactobacillus panis]QZN92340.1 carbamoyl phosphate synthase small subunit [Limosilactobacillus panis]
MASRYLIFEDGSIFAGDGFGAPAVTFGEVVFNTSMTGYQEIITNQIYNNQILIFTQPNIGSYGIQRNIYETIVPTIKGVVVRSLSNVATNNVRRLTLDQYLKQMNIPGISNVDTRAIVHKLRAAGKPLKGSIVPVPDDHAFDQLHATVLTSQQVAQVATPKPYPNPGVGKSVVVIDFGLKNGVLRQLSRRKCNVTVLPYTATTDEILRLDPDGVVLSTGPGDPNKLKSSVLKMIREVEAKVPLFAIGLGHELFAMANGARVKRLPVEHHGMNHPLHEIVTDHIVYATQGGGFQVDRTTIDRSKLFITYVDMLDNSIQGLRHRQYPAFSVQFFPDGAPGPDETNGLFDEFIEIMNRREAQR